MTIYVFCGPTISRSDGSTHLDAEFLGPAAQGDLYGVAAERPDAIGLIDGYFDSMPSVWHKEILWALHHGIHVYGSSSMGALRAAELAPFGMVGVGAIYESLLSGELEDDDEVAVAHGPPETDYCTGSEAMVNIRATLAQAMKESIIPPRTAEAFVRIAKATFYADRSWPLLFAEAESHNLAVAEVHALQRWLPANVVNQKRLDAIAMLGRMAERARAGRAPFSPSFHFEHTAAWENARRRVDALRTAPSSATDREVASEDAIIEEAQIAKSFQNHLGGSLTRTLAIEHARMTGRTVEGEVLYTAIEAFRRERGLGSDPDFERWLEDNSVGDLEFFKEEAQAQLVQTLYHSQALRQLPDHLRSCGEYRQLTRRAREKERAVTIVDASGRDNGASCDEAELFRWYFLEHLGRMLPADLDRYARQLGMSDLVAFRRAVWRERIYVASISHSDDEGQLP
jgi:hypothetical protein